MLPVQVKHASDVRLDNSKMIEKIAKVTNLASISGEEAVQDGSADVMEELGDCHQIRGSSSFADSAICRGRVASRVFYAGQN
jgi:hypothetical protein